MPQPTLDRRPGGSVITVDARGAGDSGWSADVQRPSADVIALLNQEVVRDPAAVVVFLVRGSSAGSGSGAGSGLGAGSASGSGSGSGAGALEEALVQAVRGIAGTAALELGATGGRSITVLADDTTHPADVDTTLAYLLDPVRAGYTTGATIDLRRNDLAARSTTGTVLVTGAAGALGSAAAEAIAATGRRVVLTDRAGEALESAGERLGAPVIACDLTDAAQLDALAASAELADLDAIVVHHGVSASTRFGPDYDYSVSDRSLVLNGRTVYDVVELLLPRLRGGGTVIVLSSQAGLTAEAGNGPYCAAKFAAIGYVTALARSAAAQGVSVHALCPGPIDTPLLRLAFEGFAAGLGQPLDDFVRDRVSGIPLGRIGDPAEIGASSAYLLGLHATGVILAPNGGETLT